MSQWLCTCRSVSFFQNEKPCQSAQSMKLLDFGDALIFLPCTIMRIIVFSSFNNIAYPFNLCLSFLIFTKLNLQTDRSTVP